MKNQVPFIDEVVSSEDVVCFFSDIEYMLERIPLSNVYIIDSGKQFVVISFDAEWKPFIGITRGYNLPEERHYLLSWGNLISIISGKLQSEKREIKGGRVFIMRCQGFSATDEEIKSFVCKTTNTRG